MIYRYCPRGQEAPPLPPYNPHTFAHTIDAFVKGSNVIGQVLVCCRSVVIRADSRSQYIGKLLLVSELHSLSFLLIIAGVAAACDSECVCNL